LQCLLKLESEEVGKSSNQTGINRDQSRRVVTPDLKERGDSSWEFGDFKVKRGW